MSDESGASAGGIDFAVVAYRDEGDWQVSALPFEQLDDLTDVSTLADELRRWPAESGCLGMISVDEDFFVLVRVAGDRVGVLLSDIAAAAEFPLGLSAIEHLDLPLPDDDDEDDVPAGDLALVADLGMSAMDMGVLLDDYELYPDEMLGDIAAKLGFGALFDEVVGVPAL